VWATDITFIPMPSGFVYLTVILDWYSRKILELYPIRRTGGSQK